MNIFPKYHVFSIIMFCLTSACSAQETEDSFKYPEKQCKEAKNGTLDVSVIDYRNPLVNSYLLHCALVSEPSRLIKISGNTIVETEKQTLKAIKEVSTNKKEKKAKIAYFLLSKKVDVDFRDKGGETLLMTVIGSLLSNDWKEKMVTILIERGDDVNGKNIYGKTAIDTAKFKNNKNLVKILFENGAIN